MNNLSRRDKGILISMIVIILAFLYYTFVLEDIIDETIMSINKIKEAEAIIDSKEIINDTINNSQKSLKSLKEKMNDTEESVPFSDEISEINKRIKKYADSENCTLSNIIIDDYISSSTKEINEDEKTKEIMEEIKLISMPLTIDIEGEYESILNFINKMEEDKRLIDIKNVNISNSQGAKATINVNYYYIENQ